MVQQRKTQKLTDKQKNFQFVPVPTRVDYYTSDPTNNIGNPGLTEHAVGHVIHFVHVATHATCHFKAFLTNWTDQFKQDWKDYTTVGRMDPIKIYTRTSRQISFSFTVPSYSLQEAAFNLEQIEKLIQMSYPTFESVTLTSTTVGQNNSTSTSNTSTAITEARTNNITQPQNTPTITYGSLSTMVSPPFFRIKFANWLNDPSIDRNFTSKEALTSGLYGTIDTVKFEPDLTDSGGFYSAADLYDNGNLNNSEQVLIPKALKIDINFNVLHTNPLGYDASTKSVRTNNFPYNAGRMYQNVKTKVVKVK